jgi:hypothetical protein
VTATRISRRLDGRPRAGSVMLYAIAGLLMLMFLSLTLLMIARSMVGHAIRRGRELHALAAAEAACSRGMAMLEAGAVTTVPYQETSVPLGRQTMDIEIVPAETGVATPYTTANYEIRGTGHAGNIQRTIALGGRHDSFLSFSRYLEAGPLSYAPGATLGGRVYCGCDITLTGYPVTFRQDVEVVGQIVNRSCGVYQSHVLEGAPATQLSSAMDPASFRALATAAGLYYNSASPTPEIDLSLFDFSTSPPRYGTQNLPANFNGVIFSEYDLAVKGLLEGRSLTLVANDQIIISGNIRTGCSRQAAALVSPSLTFNADAGQEAVSSANLTPLLTTPSDCVTVDVSGANWQRVTMYVYEDSHLLGVETLERPPGVSGNLTGTTVLSGVKIKPAAHSYRAEVHYWSNGTGQATVDVGLAAGDPVNVGLIARNEVCISQYTPRVLRVDAALFSRDSCWRPVDYADDTDSDNSHPACTGVYDLDGDGTIETMDEDGWNETAANQNTWMLTINGPIITKDTGSAGPWSYQGTATGKGTRHYNYDDDVVYYQPPSFPVMLSRWAMLYWREA